MKGFLTEILSIAVIFVSVWIFAVIKFRKNEAKFGLNLAKFGAVFNVQISDEKDLRALCLNLIAQNKMAQIDKLTTQKEFVNIIKNLPLNLSENLEKIPTNRFKNEPSASDEIVSRNFIHKCVSALNPPFAIGLLSLTSDEYALILSTKAQLLLLIKIASELGESIIFCD